MAQPHAHSQPIQTYGPAPHNRNIWPHNSRATVFCHAWPILLFALVVVVIPLLMYVCMHACMYVCMHACMYVCMYVYMTYIPIHDIHAFVYICTYVNAPVSVYACLCQCVNMCSCMSACQ